MAIQFLSFKRVTFEQSRQEEAEYWATKTVAERVIAGWELADDDLFKRVTHDPESRATFTLCRVGQSRR